MSTKIKDPKTGVETEYFTKEELAAAEKKASETASGAALKVAEEKAQQAIDAYKTSNPDRSTEVDKLKNDLSQAQAKLEQAESYNRGNDGGDTDQIKRLRQERDEAVAQVNKKVDELSGTIKMMNETQITGLKDKLLDEYAGKDPEARAKVALEFDNYRAGDTTLKGMTERMEKAVVISGVKVEAAPGALDAAGGQGSARGDGNYRGNATAVTPNAVSIGKVFGVTEAELAAQAEKNAADKK